MEIRLEGVKLNVYFIEEPFYTTHTAGSKPRNDFNTILKDFGFTSLQTKIQQDGLILNLDDLLFIQYTFTGSWKQTVYKALSKQKVRVVLFINDISSLHDGNYEMIQQEIELFNKAAYLIVHNKQMMEWLTHQGITTPMFSLEIFDYLIDDEVYRKIKPRTLANEVIFAGNLNPSLRKFLYDPEFKHTYQLNLYGPEVRGNLELDSSKYYGSYSPEEIPAHLEGSFALLWNGERQDTCSGHVGFYSTLATSHKLSLYLLSGLPIICWEKASEAKLVQNEKIGFTIQHLDEIETKLAKITGQEYEEMVQNLAKYPARLKDGYYMKQAVTTIIESLT